MEHARLWLSNASSPPLQQEGDTPECKRGDLQLCTQQPLQAA